jgi:hypothetical protein
MWAKLIVSLSLTFLQLYKNRMGHRKSLIVCGDASPAPYFQIEPKLWRCMSLHHIIYVTRRDKSINV